MKIISLCLCIGLFALADSIPCPCSNPDLCKVVTTTFPKELIVFTGASDLNWKKWNWTEISNVIWFGSLDNYKDLYCFAHGRGVRFTYLVGSKLDNLPKPDYREQITNGWINTVKNYSLDGINIDIEGPAFTKEYKQGLNDLVSETYAAFKSINSNYLVTMDVFYSPDLIGCISGLCYDYVPLSKTTDYFIVMDYDATLDILFAQANSPYDLIQESYGLYINNLSISPDHLVMAIPWYGYDYTCTKFYNRTGDNLCVIIESTNSQLSNKDIDAKFTNNIGGLKWDPVAKSPFFTTKENGTFHQYWFDNLDSLKAKYQLAEALKLRGLGMWTADELDYTSTDPAVIDRREQMWDIINVYVKRLSLNQKKNYQSQYNWSKNDVL